MGPKFNMLGDLIRRVKFGQRHIQREASRMKTEAKIGGMQPQDKDTWGHQKLE